MRWICAHARELSGASSGPLPGAMPEGFVPRSAAASEGPEASDQKLAVILALLAAGYDLGQQALDYMRYAPVFGDGTYVCGYVETVCGWAYRVP